MTETVSIIEAFDTTIGIMITVKDDRSYRVGQIVRTNNECYRIEGIQPHHDPDAQIIALRVTKMS